MSTPSTHTEAPVVAGAPTTAAVVPTASAALVDLASAAIPAPLAAKRGRRPTKPVAGKIASRTPTSVAPRVTANAPAKPTAKSAVKVVRRAPALAKPAGRAAPTATKKKVVMTSAPRVTKPTKAEAPLRAPAAATAPKKGKSETRLVRDSFKMPKAEYTVIDKLKRRVATFGQRTKKSELLRAGLKALTSMSDDTLRAALAAVPTIRTGRPNKG